MVFGVAAARVFDLFLASLGHPMRSYFEFSGKLKICFFFGTGGIGSRFQNRSVGTGTKPNQTELELAVQCNVFSGIDCQLSTPQFGKLKIAPRLVFRPSSVPIQAQK